TFAFLCRAYVIAQPHLDFTAPGQIAMLDLVHGDAQRHGIIPHIAEVWKWLHHMFLARVVPGAALPLCAVVRADVRQLLKPSRRCLMRIGVQRCGAGWGRLPAGATPLAHRQWAYGYFGCRIYSSSADGVRLACRVKLALGQLHSGAMGGDALA